MEHLGATSKQDAKHASTQSGSVGQASIDERALARIHAFNPQADPVGRIPDVPPSRLPRHVAIIMDGNGRWAQERGFPRQFGHINGAAAVRRVVEECVKLGIEAVTLYSFSLENWKRPAEEVEGLMRLCLTYLEGEEEEMMRQGIAFRTIGRREGLPTEVLQAIDRVSERTKGNRRATVCMAINYGSRSEITDAAKAIAAKVKSGDLRLEEIDEACVSAHLGTHGLPDPDLVVRTAGELRISNFLLWQISYAELYVTAKYWPDFEPGDLHEAVRAFAKRSRRFGAIEEATHG
jgi:undecaprenyl diphosphate synthase